MPLYEFVCGDCDARFEELVGPHVGKDEAEVRCPECGAAGAERQLASRYSPIHRQLTPNQRRRLEQQRGTDRGGAKERFKQQRARERGTRRGGGRGG